MEETAQTPEAEPVAPEVPRPRYALHSPKNVAIGTLFGSPAVGAWLMMTNDTRLGLGSGAKRKMVMAAVLALIAGVAGFVLPEDFPILILFPISAVVVYEFAARAQGKAFRAHLDAGGEGESPIVAFAMGMVTLVAISGFVHLFGGMVASGPAGRVQIKNEQYVFYSDNANAEDAKRVGAVLATTPYPTEKNPFFNGDHPADVRVSKPKDIWVLSFVLTQGAWDKPEIQNGYRQMGVTLRDALFPGQAMAVHLCDAGWHAVKKINVPAN